jgi:hypothetical protein
MYTCRLCAHRVNSIQGYVNHCSLHRNIAVFKAGFPCPVRSCLHAFSNYFSLVSHLRRTHNEVARRKVYRVAENDSNFTCSHFTCYAKTFSTSAEYIAHIKSHFGDGSGFSVRCPFNNCGKSYSVKSSFTAHISRKHADTSAEILPAPNAVVDTADDLDGDDVCRDNDSNCLSLIEQEQFLTSMALFYLKLQAKLLIPASTVQLILEEYGTVNTVGQNHVCSWLKEKLRLLGIEQDKVDEVALEFMQNDLFNKFTKGPLRSDKSRKAFYKSNFSYVEPREIFLGEDDLKKKRYCMYVPIIDSLTALLKQPAVKHQFEAGGVPDGGQFLQDICDGEVIKQSRFFIDNPKAIQIVLYADAFEVANPLGSGRKKHKVHAVYFILANLEIFSRSSVDQIQLALLCREADFKKFGSNKVYGQLMSDLQKLEKDGFTIDGECIKGSVVSFCADNLGAHEIGGFTENFSRSEFFCRYCQVSRESFVISPATIGKLRTPENYREAVSNGTFGVKSNSILNSLDHYHVCMPGLAPCLGHDLLEGIVPKDMALCIRYFVKHRWFTICQLNLAILSFQYLGSDLKNKPPALSSTGIKIVGQAAENWCLLRLFPLIVSKWVVNHKDNVWQFLLQLREIVEIVVSPKVTVDQVAYLKYQVEDYVSARFRLFSSVKLLPKHHFLVHYADLVIKLGPLVRVWTMRFESKHKYFKQCIRKSQNFKNVCKSMAERHQLLQAYLSSGSVIKNKIQFDTALEFDQADYCLEVQGAVSFLDLSRNESFVSQSVTVKGTEYRKGLFVPVDSNETGLVFGRIIIILVMKHVEEVYLVVERFQSSRLIDLGVHCIDSINENKSVQCISVDKLLDYYPLPKYEVHNLWMLPLHHGVSCTV